MLPGKTEACALVQNYVQIKQWRISFDIVIQPVSNTRNETHPNAFISKYGKSVRRVISKRWSRLFVFLWKCHPGLNHFKFSPGQCRRVFKSFRMGNTTTSSHPVYFTRTNDLLNTQTIPVCYAASEKITDCRESDMRMRQDVE